MDRLSPAPAPEPIPTGSAGGRALRGTIYLVLAGLLIGGAGIRFNNQIASVAPFLAAPDLDQSAPDGNAPRALLDLAVMPHAAEPAALAAIGLPVNEQAALQAALKKEQVRLVQLPLFDAGGVTADGTDAGRSVMVRTAGFSRVVRLGRQPVVVTLPINRAGTVSFSTVGSEPVQVGAITIVGPVRLPEIARNTTLSVGVATE